VAAGSQIMGGLTMPRHEAGSAGTVPGIFRRYWMYTRGDRGRLLAGWPLAASAATASAARVGEILDGAVPAMTAMRR